MIPGDRISHNGQALLNSYPLPIPGFLQGTSNWIGTFPHFSDTRKDTVKVDYMISDTEHLTFRGTHIPWHFDSPNEGSNFGLTQALWSRPNRTAALSLTSTLSPSLINEFTLSANSDGLGNIAVDPRCGAPCRRSSYGINYPYIFPGTKIFDEKLPDVAVSGFTTTTDSPYPGSWSGFVYALANNTTKILGNHTLKFGVFIERSGENDHIQFTTRLAPATINENGSFRFLDGSFTGSGVGNAVLGLFSDYSELGGKTHHPLGGHKPSTGCAG